MRSGDLRGGLAAGHRRRDAPRSDGLGGRRGPRARRRVRPVQGPGRGIRAGAHRRRADLGGLHHGCGGGRGHDGHAPDRRAAVFRFRAVRDRRARQPGRQSPLHVRRPGPRAAGRARADRHVAILGRPAFAVARRLVHAHPRPGRDRTGNAGGQQGAAQVRDPLRRSGRLHGAQEPLAAGGRHTRRRSAGRDRQGAHRASRQGPDHRRLVGDGARPASPPPRHSPAKASRQRSWTCAASGRGTSRRCSRASKRQGASSSRTRRCVSGGFGAEIAATVAENAAQALAAPVCGSAPRAHPSPTRRASRTRCA